MIKRDMIKAFAELEGVDLIPYRNVQLFKCNDGDISINGVQHKVYDPILDLSLNCAARDKYKAFVYYSAGDVSIQGKDHASYAFFQHEDQINSCVIECILKSKGLWNE